FLYVPYSLIFTSPVVICSSFHHPSPASSSTLSLHDALPISAGQVTVSTLPLEARTSGRPTRPGTDRWVRSCTGTRVSSASSLFVDRKSTRLNSSHVSISYAVFCLKKKKDVRYIAV